MVYTKRKRGRPSRADREARNGAAQQEKSPVSQADEESEDGEEELVPEASVPVSLQTLLETLSQQAALIVEQNTRIEQRITCLEQGISRIDQQNGLLELQNDRIEQQIVRIEERTVAMEEQLAQFISTPGTIEKEPDDLTPEKQPSQPSAEPEDRPPSAKEPFSIRPATTGEQVFELDNNLGDAAYYAEATKWLDFNVYQAMAKNRMHRTLDLLISPALQTKCYWNSARNEWKLPLLKFRKNILRIIKDISTTDFETVTDADVHTFISRKLRTARRHQPRQPGGVRVTVNSCDETSIELDDNTSIDSSSLDFGDNDNDDGKQQQQQEQTYEIQEEKLIDGELRTGNDDDTSIDLDDLDSIDDELDEIEFD